MDIWFEKHGFIANPFNIKPGLYDDEVFGYNKSLKKIFSGVKRGSVFFIEGNFGVGKTTILKNVMNNFKGRKRVIYFSANRSEGGIDFKTLLMNRNGFFQRWFGVLPNNMILLVDEAHKITYKDALNIEKLLKDKNIKSVVFASDKMEDVNLTPKLLKRIGTKNRIKLEPLTETFAIKMVRNRVGDFNFLPNPIIKKVFNLSGKNPRTFFENLEEVCRVASNENAKKVTEKHLKGLKK